MIQVVALGHVVVGMALPLAASSDAVAFLLVDTVFAGISLTDPVRTQAVYLIAVFGPTVASWGILMFVLANSYFAAPTAGKWLGMVLAVLVWFIGDTLYSVINGVNAAIVLNSLVALSFIVPLGFSRRLVEGTRALALCTNENER